MTASVSTAEILNPNLHLKSSTNAILVIKAPILTSLTLNPEAPYASSLAAYGVPAKWAG